MTGITTLRRGSGPGQIALQSELPPTPAQVQDIQMGDRVFLHCSLIYRLLHTSCMSTNSLRHTNTGTLSTTHSHGYSHPQETLLCHCTPFQRSTCQDWLIMTWIWRVRSRMWLLRMWKPQNRVRSPVWSFDNEDKSDARRKSKENKQSVSFKYLSHPWRDTSSNKQDQVLHRFFGQQWRTCHWVRCFGQQSQVLHGRL